MHSIILIIAYRLNDKLMSTILLMNLKIITLMQQKNELQFHLFIYVILWSVFNKNDSRPWAYPEVRYFFWCFAYTFCVQSNLLRIIQLKANSETRKMYISQRDLRVSAIIGAQLNTNTIALWYPGAWTRTP